MLEQNRAAAVRVLVVWEPILPTDWSRPGGMVQSRVSDSRVVQFWDKDHFVAKELKQQFPGSRKLCCQRNGVLWDVAALYPPKIKWGAAEPTYFGGAVLDVTDDVRQQLSLASGAH
jgi:hypothetical protein